MLGILKKDSFVYLYLFVITFGFSGLAILMDGLDRSVVILLGSFMALTILGAVGSIEQTEDKNHGYTFLSTIPITTREIVTGKFAGPVLFSLLYLTYALMVVSLLAPTPAFAALSQAYIIACAHLGLLITACMYIGIYRYGCTQFFRIMFRVFPVLVVLTPLMIREIFLDTITQMNLTSIIEFASITNWLLVSACGIIIYFGLMQVAIKMKRVHVDS